MNVRKLFASSAAAVLCAALMASTALAAADTWKIDAGHSTISFSVRHFVAKAHGRFTKYEGAITLDTANMKEATAHIEIETASINTDNENRDKHLKSPDFLDVEKFPTITFKSTAVKPGDDMTGIIVGDFTMRGVTKPVELKYEVLGFGPDAWGGERGGFELTGEINRKDFDVNWNAPIETGGVVLGEKVKIMIAIEAVKVKEEAEAKEG